MNVLPDFLNLVRADLCHENVVFGPGPSLFCQVCKTTPIPNVYDYIDRDFPHDRLYSCTLAQAYYRQTGDDNVRVSFYVLGATGILPQCVQGQTLRRLRESIQLMKAINAPFIQDASPHTPTELMETFLQKYVQAVSNQKTRDKITPGEQTFLNHLLKTMHQLLHSKDTPHPFEFYFQKLVPYVKRCVNDNLLLPRVDEETNLAKDLIFQLQFSQAIRDRYGKYSIPFEVIHVMLGCYVSSSNINVVANWALDLMARVCRGQFFWQNYKNCCFVEAMQTLLNTEVTTRKNTPLYYVKREIMVGNAAESLSSFLPNYMQLEMLIKDKFASKFPDVNPQVLQVATNQMFPAVIFEDNADHLGFTMELGHVACNIDPRTGLIKKGTYGTARKIHRVVSKFIRQVCKFDRIENAWTMDTLHQFLESDPTLEQDILEVSKMLLVKQDEEASMEE